MATIMGTNGNDRLDDFPEENDVIEGLSGNDTLFALGGADTLVGGTGDDVYIVHSASDLVLEDSGNGNDEIRTIVSLTIPSNIEVLSLLEFDTALRAVGSTGSDSLNGNSLPNTLIGADGDDCLGGGSGDDHLDGGFGNDWLRGDDGSDALLGESGDDTLFGGDGSDLLLGGPGNDSLWGGGFGSTGPDCIDTLDGGEGNDALYAEFDGQLIGDAGDDSLYGGSGVDVLHGGDGADRLDGGAGDDTLTGGGGNDLLICVVGNDLMKGGSGDDVYAFVSPGSTLSENSGGGVDLAISSTTRALGRNFENLLLTDTASGGTGNFRDNQIFGNSRDNLLAGWSGNDFLFGGLGDDAVRGGSGDDTLVGSEGDDTLDGGSGRDDYVFGKQALDGVDTLLSFQLGFDRLVLQSDAFGGLTSGALDARSFRVGDTALDADDRILYDLTSGTLWFDVDGSGGGAAHLFAIIEGDLPRIRAEDFIVASPFDASVFGGLADDSLTGGLGRDHLAGGEGNDHLYAGTFRQALFADGDSGGNRLDGGSGDDILFGSIGGDTLIGGDGGDYLQASPSLEPGFGPYGSDLLDGGEGNDYIAGNTGSVDVTTGHLANGGGGDDTMLGASGSDTYFGGDGNDIIKGDWFSPAASNISGIDYLSGGSGNDIISCSGDGGRCFGEEGDDFLVAGGILHVGGGRDWPAIAGNYIGGTQLGGDPSATTEPVGGSMLDGGIGQDTLYGDGGEDTLIGGLGNDLLVHCFSSAETATPVSFVFDCAPAQDNVDTVEGFLHGADRIVLNSSVFTALEAGPLSTSAFRLGPNAQDADDRILLESHDAWLDYHCVLRYDPDGNGPTSSVTICELVGSYYPDSLGNFDRLGVSDFFVV